MTMKPMKPLPQQQVQIDLSDADTMKCQKCENSIFIQGYVIKKISAIVSPTGKEQIIPVPTYRCDDCGYINEEFRVIDGK